MSKSARETVGFDIETAIYTLHQEALAAGAVPEGSWSGRTARETALAHLHSDGRTRCERRPCRAGGLCHALYELTQVRGEAADVDGAIHAADETEVMRKAFSKACQRYVKTLDGLSQRSKERHRLDHDLGPRESRSQHEVLCVAPRGLLSTMAVLMEGLTTFEGALRARTQSFQLQQPGNKRRADHLRTGVYQHLHWGGIDEAEIAALVPDGLGQRGAAERVRGRIKMEDQRTMVPVELAPRFAERREKRRLADEKRRLVRDRKHSASQRRADRPK